MDFNSVVCGVVGGVAEVNRGEQGEYKGLQESHQQLQEVHENHEGRGENPHARSSSDGVTAVTEDENQTRKREDDDVSRADVRGQTNHQYRRLHDDAERLDWHQNKLHRQRYTGRPEDVAPVMLVSVQVGQEEDQRRQNDRYTDRAGNVESAQERNQSQEVTEENEEEDRQQKRHELIRLVSN